MPRRPRVHLDAVPLHIVHRGHNRDLLRSHPDQVAIDAIRLALNQNQPLGNERFLTKIEKVTGVRCEPRPRGRPRLEEADISRPLPGQGKLALE